MGQPALDHVVPSAGKTELELRPSKEEPGVIIDVSDWLQELDSLLISTLVVKELAK